MRTNSPSIPQSTLSDNNIDVLLRGTLLDEAENGFAVLSGVTVVTVTLPHQTPLRNLLKIFGAQSKKLYAPKISKSPKRV